MAQVKNINMTPDIIPPVIKLSQYDVGREISFVTRDGSNEYVVPLEATVTLEGTKPSSLGFTINCAIYGSKVVAVTTADMTDEYGTVVAELVVRQGGNRIGSSNVRIDVEKSPHPEGTTDGRAETLIPEITVLMTRAEEAAAAAEAALEEMQGLTAEASPLDASEQPTVEYDPEENKLSFGIPRGYNGYEIEGTIGFADTSSDGDIVITMS